MFINNSTTNPSVITLYKLAKANGHANQFTRYNDWSKDINRFKDHFDKVYVVFSAEKHSISFFIIGKNGAYFSTWIARSAKVYNDRLIKLGFGETIVA